MTTLPALNYVSNASRTQGEVKAALEATNTFIRDKFGSESTGWTDVASAGTTDIGAASSDIVRITGTTTITSFGTAAAGVRRYLRFAGALTLTHNGTSLILPGSANITTAANDTCLAISLGSGNWIVSAYQRAVGVISNVTAGNGASVSVSNGVATISAGPTIATSQATTSGTEFDFTGIPSGTKRVTILLSQVSTNYAGSANLIIRLGAGSVQATGYSGSTATAVNSASSNAAAISTGFELQAAAGAGDIQSGSITFNHLGGNVWVASGVVGFENTARVSLIGGRVSLSGALDRVRLTTTNGTDTFDNGSVTITYE